MKPRLVLFVFGQNLLDSQSEAVDRPGPVTLDKSYLIFVTNFTNGIRGENLPSGEIPDFYTRQI